MLINDRKAGLIDHDAWELDRKLREGDGVSWPGDPHLTLELRVVERKVGGKVQTGRRYEVWRACEDGQDRMIHHCRLEEKDLILSTLAALRVEAPGHEDTLTAMRRENAEVEARNAALYRDSMGEAISHLTALMVDTSPHEAKTTFRQVGGFRDERP